MLWVNLRAYHVTYGKYEELKEMLLSVKNPDKSADIENIRKGSRLNCTPIVRHDLTMGGAVFDEL